VTNYKGAAIIAFAVDDASKTVSIIGVFYGEQDFETLLQDELGQ
jgi:toxin ParE1/3/4